MVHHRYSSPYYHIYGEEYALKMLTEKQAHFFVNMFMISLGLKSCIIHMFLMLPVMKVEL
jgi:hypothetical protein